MSDTVYQRGVYAFFDVDETLINRKSLFDFVRFCSKQWCWWHRLRCWYILKFIGIGRRLHIKRALLNRLYYSMFKGIAYTSLQQQGVSWWKEVQSQTIFHPQVLQALRGHQLRGDRVVFVSGSVQACLQPIADMLGVQYVLCTEQQQHGVFSGRIRYPMIGHGKAQRIKEFLLQAGAWEKRHQAYAYGDHISDIPMLQLVGYPVGVGKAEGLRRYIATTISGSMIDL